MKNKNQLIAGVAGLALLGLPLVAMAASISTYQVTVANYLGQGQTIYVSPSSSNITILPEIPQTLPNNYNEAFTFSSTEEFGTNVYSKWSFSLNSDHTNTICGFSLEEVGPVWFFKPNFKPGSNCLIKAGSSEATVIFMSSPSQSTSQSAN